MEAKRKIKPQNPKALGRRDEPGLPQHGASQGIRERVDRGPRGPQSPGGTRPTKRSGPLPALPLQVPQTAVFGGSPSTGATAGWDARPGDRRASDFVETVFKFRCRSKAKTG